MVITTLTRRTASAPSLSAPSNPSPRAAVGWLAGGAATTFALSLLGTTVLGLHHDVFYLVYFTFVLGYLAWFASRSEWAWREVLRRNIWWSLGIGAAMAFAVVRQVMDQVGTAHPGGAFYALELVWRGVVYGSVDGLTLGVFPAVVAYLLLRGNRKGPARKVAFAALVVVCSMVVSISYHLGYSTYRGKDLAKPALGTVMIDVPAILTGNPAGAVVEHAAVHTTAVVHQYYGGKGTDHFLPPELSSTYPDRPGGAAALAITAGWMVVVAAVLTTNRRRIRELLQRPSPS